MGIATSSQINDPAVETLKALDASLNVLILLQQVQNGALSIPDLGKQIAAAYALTDTEKAERDGAAMLVSTSQSTVNTVTQQVAQMQNDAAATLARATTSANSARAAVDAYKQGVESDLAKKQQEILTQKEDLETAQDTLAADQRQLMAIQSSVTLREIAVAKREETVAKIEAAQKNLLAVAEQAANQ